MKSYIHIEVHLQPCRYDMRNLLNQCFSTPVLCVYGTLNLTRLNHMFTFYSAIAIWSHGLHTRQQFNSVLSVHGAFHIHFMSFSITFYPFSYFMNID